MRRVSLAAQRVSRLRNKLSYFQNGYGFARNFSSANRSVGGRSVRTPLEDYFDSHTVGPGIWKWRHYFSAYDRHLSKFRGQPVHVLEVGVYSGGSLEMWRNYFGENAQIYGVDIELACRAYEGAGTRIFIGDQSDGEFWKRVTREAPRLDVVIDDGGHQPPQQIATLEALLPHLQPGGVYICEDIHGPGNLFCSYLDGMSRNLHETAGWKTGVALTVDPIEWQRLVDSVHLYPFLAVIERRATEVELLNAEKRGTEWQPFLKVEVP